MNIPAQGMYVEPKSVSITRAGTGARVDSCELHREVLLHQFGIVVAEGDVLQVTTDLSTTIYVIVAMSDTIAYGVAMRLVSRNGPMV